MSEDYSVKKGEFSWALELMKQGKRVKRSGFAWTIKIKKCPEPKFALADMLADMTEDYIYAERDNMRGPWVATNADLLAADWELAED